MYKYLFFFIISCFLFGSGSPMAQPIKDKQTADSLSIDDMQYLRKMSAMVKDMEDSLGINASNMSKKVKLVNPRESEVIEPDISVIKVAYANSLNEVLFSYAHNMYNAIHISIYKKIYNKATSHKITRTAFADSLSMQESKAVYNTILIGLETGTTHSLPYPNNVVNAVIDKVKRKINTATALYVVLDFIKRDAKDANNILLYDIYLKHYDQLSL